MDTTNGTARAVFTLPNSPEALGSVGETCATSFYISSFADAMEFDIARIQAQPRLRALHLGRESSGKRMQCEMKRCLDKARWALFSDMGGSFRMWCSCLMPYISNAGRAYILGRWLCRNVPLMQGGSLHSHAEVRWLKVVMYSPVEGTA